MNPDYEVVHYCSVFSHRASGHHARPAVSASATEEDAVIDLAPCRPVALESKLSRPGHRF
jgi:hypothetical protein